MIWVWVFLAIAVAGLVVMVSYGVWLFHKAGDIYAEVTMLGRRAEELHALLGQLELNPQPRRDGAALVPVVAAREDDLEVAHNA
ncbi:hypothetical protein IPV09_00980 [Tessaracoccus sp. SD287]|uniref:hypothetical protein n=1 Tax=Tessaracoccus sp. SD287 TaxID=2782008 RepID=UPI001A9764AB|nr:hypothetical protein [Tessaracoccus sp. SD287]MBO1029907.1 hypothetical protein [Tessaracoccus sp. SD287]